MDEINKLIEAIQIEVTIMADADSTQTAFTRACTEVDLWKKIEGAARAKGSQARQARNAFLPIQRLPTEAALHLFNMVLLRVKRHHYYDVLKEISKVCHHWRHIIHHTPALWSKVYGSALHQIVDQALTRSATHPLEVWFDSSSKVHRIDPESFVERLSPHIDRCQSISLSYLGEQESVPGLVQLLHRPAPKLERLVLKDQRWLTNLMDEELFGGQATMLKEVEVLGIACNWGGAAFRGLAALRLSRVTFPTIDYLLEILDQIKSLSRLELRNTRFSHTDAPTTTRHINLLHLNEFSLGFDDNRNTDIIFDHIDAPICSHLCIFLSDGCDLGDRAMHLTTKWLARRPTPLRGLRSTTFALTKREIALSAISNDGKEALFLAYSCFSEDNMASLLGGVNRVAKELLNATESSFKLHDQAFYLLVDPGFVEELHQLPPVTTIEIGDPSSVGEGLEYRGYPRRFDLPSFPSLRLFRTFHQPVERVFILLKGIFATPITVMDDRMVHVEIHLEVGPEPDSLDSSVARVKEIVGVNCTASFVLAPRFEKWEH